LKKELTAIKVINNRLYRVSRKRGGIFYTIGRVAELCGIPRNVALDWVNSHKLLSPKHIKALMDRERPEGFVQKSGTEVPTTREIVYSEIRKVGNALLKDNKPFQVDDVVRIAIENCQKQHPLWTKAHIEACLYYLQDEHSAARGKPERSSIGIRKAKQRRRYIAPLFHDRRHGLSI